MTADEVATVAMTTNVDDDNTPAPENIPRPNDQPTNGFFGGWGHDGVCKRRRLNGDKSNARIKNFPEIVTPTMLQIFEIFFPMGYVKEVILPETNKELSPPLSYGGFLIWLGLWFLMFTTHFDLCRGFWSTKTIDMFEGTQMRLGEYMSHKIFEAITSALKYTYKPPPTYKYGFWEVRRLIDKWNKKMEKKSTPDWVSFLDKSMSKCLNEYTCPGFM